jgi:hypothetical protein
VLPSTAGTAFEAYLVPTGGEGFAEKSLNGTETTYTDRCAAYLRGRFPSHLGPDTWLILHRRGFAEGKLGEKASSCPREYCDGPGQGIPYDQFAAGYFRFCT